MKNSFNDRLNSFADGGATDFRCICMDLLLGGGIRHGQTFRSVRYLGADFTQKMTYRICSVVLSCAMPSSANSTLVGMAFWIAVFFERDFPAFERTLVFASIES
jgi:hypothetical protein